MDITKKVIHVSGEKIESLVLGPEALQLLNKNTSDLEEFEEQWNKKLTLTSKTKIDYSDIKTITREDTQDSIVVNYSGALGVSKVCRFEFTYEQDMNDFYVFLQEQKGFKRTDERLSNLAASKSLLIILGFFIAGTIFAYIRALDVASPDFIEDGGDSRSARKGRLFNTIVGFLGPNGVLLAGAVLIGLLGYQIWKRYNNPPIQTKFTRN